MQIRKNIITIQYLRAIAAIGVAFFHIGEVFDYGLTFGGRGVDLFFIISGFVMWMTTSKKRIDPRTFLLKRFTRITPMYWLVTIGLAVGATVKPNLFPLDHPTTENFILSMLYIPHYNSDGFILPLVLQGWTLNYEMFFYGIFALSLITPRRAQFFWLNVALLFCVALGVVFSPESAIAKVYSSPLLIEFILGVAICKAWMNDKLLSSKISIAAIVLSLYWWGYTYYIGNDIFPRFISGGIPAVLIVYALISIETHRSIKDIKLFKLLGDASYSIYLTHNHFWLVFSLVMIKLNAEQSFASYMIGTTLAIFGGVVTYILIEKPIDRFIHKHFFNK